MNELNKQTKTEAVDEDAPSMSGAIGSFIWEISKVLILAIVIILPLRVFVAEPFIVSGLSMFPTYENKDYLIIDKVSYRLKEPSRGDVIVFRYPKDTSQYFIKRIIALPGEKVQVNDGRVLIYNESHPDGQRLEEPFLKNEAVTFGKPEIVSLGEGEYYVLGDNRGSSSDSRSWGILPKNDIVGKVLIRLFPITHAGLISTPSLSM
jgi:signal peptidase I